MNEIVQSRTHSLIVKLQQEFGIKDTMFPMDEQIFDNMIYEAFGEAVKIDTTKLAREIRLAIVQQQYRAGNLTLDEAKQLLSGPLVPGDEKTIYDDFAQLVE